MHSVLTSLPLFAHALWLTLLLSLSAAILGGILGFVLNILRLTFPLFIWPYRLYIWLTRGTPYLAQLFVAYFGLPIIGITLSAVQATIFSLALYSAAYFAELFRTAWNTVPIGQLEAARVHGIPPRQIFWKIQAPQAFAFCIPLLGNQVILTIKESAVASIITVPELTMTAGEIVSNTFSYVVPYTLLVLSYWLLTHSVSLISRFAAVRTTRYLKG